MAEQSWWTNHNELAAFLTWMHSEHGCDAEELIQIVQRPDRYKREHRIMTVLLSGEWVDLYCRRCDTGGAVKPDHKWLKSVNETGETCELCPNCREDWLRVQLPEEFPYAT